MFTLPALRLFVEAFSRLLNYLFPSTVVVWSMTTSYWLLETMQMIKVDSSKVHNCIIKDNKAAQIKFPWQFYKQS